MPIDCLNDNVPVYDPDEKGCYRWMSIKAGQPSKFCSDVTFEGGIDLPPNTIIRIPNPNCVDGAIEEPCFDPPLDFVGPGDEEFYPPPLIVGMTSSTIYANHDRRNPWCNAINDARRFNVNYNRTFKAFPNGQQGEPQFGELLWNSRFTEFEFPFFQEKNTFFRWQKAYSYPIVGDLGPGSAPYAQLVYDGGNTTSGSELPAPLNENPLIQSEGHIRINTPGQYRLTITLNYLNALIDQNNDEDYDGVGFESHLWMRVIDFTTDVYNWKIYGDIRTDFFPSNLETTQSAVFYINITPEDLAEAPSGFIQLHTFMYYFGYGCCWSQDPGNTKKPPEVGNILFGEDRGASINVNPTTNKGQTSMALEYIASSQGPTVANIANGSLGLIGGGSNEYVCP